MPQRYSVELQFQSTHTHTLTHMCVRDSFLCVPPWMACGRGRRTEKGGRNENGKKNEFSWWHESLLTVRYRRFGFISRFLEKKNHFLFFVGRVNFFFLRPPPVRPLHDQHIRIQSQTFAEHKMCKSAEEPVFGTFGTHVSTHMIRAFIITFL